MRLADLTIGMLCAGALACLVAPAFAQEAEEAAGHCVGKVRLHGPLWELSTSRLEPGLDVVLDRIARAIRERCGAKRVIIESHAFEMPTAELNEQLSVLRAALVKHELEKRGVPAAQLLPAPYGDTRPLFPKDAPNAARENRRITFRVAD